MNKVMLYGRLTADPEVRYTQNGKAVTSFTLAVNRPKAKDAEQAEADFIRCQAWGSMAEMIGNHFSKGKAILCSGSIKTGSYEKEGKKVYTTDINIKEVWFTEPKAKPQAETHTNEQHYQDIAQNNPAFKQPQQSDFGAAFGTSFDEEIPF